MEILIEKSKMIFSEKEKDSFKYNLLPIGNFYDDRYGWLSFDETRLKNLERRFNDGVPAYEVPIKKGHWEEEKMGAIEEVWFEDETGLWINVKLNEEGVKELEKQDYLSAELELYTDKKTGEGAETLTGAAFTNKPANPYVQKIQFSEDKTIEIIVKKELKKEEEKEMPKTVEELEKELKKEREEKEEAIRKLDKTEEEKIKLSENTKKLTVENYKTKWEKDGVPPSVIEEAEKIMLSEMTEEGKILLSEGKTKEELDIIGVVKKIVEKVPRIDLSEKGKKGKENLEGYDNEDKAIEKLGEGGTL